LICKIGVVKQEHGGPKETENPRKSEMESHQLQRILESEQHWSNMRLLWRRSPNAGRRMDKHASIFVTFFRTCCL
jgi:hypothetical protein